MHYWVLINYNKKRSGNCEIGCTSHTWWYLAIFACITVTANTLSNAVFTRATSRCSIETYLSFRSDTIFRCVNAITPESCVVYVGIKSYYRGYSIRNNILFLLHISKKLFHMSKIQKVIYRDICELDFPLESHLDRNTLFHRNH